jgi:hypothetical protein
MLVDDLNAKLEERGRTLDGRPIWRLTWSTSQREKRRGKFSDYYGNIFLREVEQVREVPKYWNNPNRWVLERLCFLPLCPYREVLSQTSDLDIFSPTVNGTYEPIYFFQDGLEPFLLLSLLWTRLCTLWSSEKVSLPIPTSEKNTTKK